MRQMVGSVVSLLNVELSTTMFELAKQLEQCHFVKESQKRKETRNVKNLLDIKTHLAFRVFDGIIVA